MRRLAIYTCRVRGALRLIQLRSLTERGEPENEAGDKVVSDIIVYNNIY